MRTVRAAVRRAAVRRAAVRRARVVTGCTADGITTASAVPTDSAAGAGPRTGEEGNAIVEFLGAALILLVPVVYLVLVLGRLQAAAFAVDGASREAARTFVAAADAHSGEQRAVAAVALALGDQGFDADAAAGALTLVCAPEPCLAPGGTVTATVEVDVALPGVPGFLQAVVPMTIPVSGHARAATDTYVGRG